MDRGHALGVNLASILGGTEDLADRTGGDRWRTNIRELYNYLRRDMRDARVQRERVYKINGKSHIQRTVPLVSRLAREIASAYRRPPSRSWRLVNEDGTPGAKVSGRLLERLKKLYHDAQVDKRMRQAHEQRATLHNATLWVWPEVDASKPPVRVMLIPPHEQDVELSDPTGQDESDVKRWQFRLPLRHDLDSGQVFYGLAEVTATSAHWVSGPEPFQGRGLYGDGKDNPFQQIPVVMLRGSEPGAGEWWSPCPEDLLDAQRAINHDFTDVGEIARKQGFGQPVRKGGAPSGTQGDTRELQLGPETAVEVDDTGDFKFASADPKLDGYVTQLRQYLEAVIATNEMSPETLLKAQGLTALAKRLSLIDRDDARAESLADLKRAEQRLYDLMRLALNWATRTETLPPLLVEVEYYEPVVPTDPLADSQADAIDIDRRFTSTARVRARRDGVSLEEAMRRIEEDDKFEAERGRKLAAAVTLAPEPGDAVSTPAPAAGAAPVAGVEDVAKTALNGAQVGALLQSLAEVSAGRLSKLSAREAILLSFPDFDEARVQRMLDAIEVSTVDPAPAPGPAGEKVKVPDDAEAGEDDEDDEAAA